MTINKFIILICIASLALISLPFPGLAQRIPEQDYLVYVVCESADKIALVRFGPKGIKVEKIIDTGAMFPDIDGPHGIVVSPDKQYYYVSLGHGRPFGRSTTTVSVPLSRTSSSRGDQSPTASASAGRTARAMKVILRYVAYPPRRATTSTFRGPYFLTAGRTTS